MFLGSSCKARLTLILGPFHGSCSGLGKREYGILE